ncbi:hypothetical protein [Nostoc sp. ChiQUE01b]|uniref:hypothetical protein n=1 Tax=Nostoc sp. ChiQUE01b TaxID=3075376 RepID=UPI002AD2B29B|nr:hypothetical protein [Nostoc sp. ChiQUE01b]MDZ8259444.1 hypothetical protein [Nostoc sp. ChiQUE01b]
MPTQRIIKSTFIGLNNEPLRNAVVQVIHMQGSTIDNIEYPQVTKNFVTDREGKIKFTLWCNEEGERPSFYRFVLPGGETFDAIVPVGTSDLELSVLREGGADTSDPQHQSLISYILNEIGINLASNTLDGRVKTNTNSSDPVVYLKSEVDNLLSPKANQSTTYTKAQTDGLVNPKANSSDVYTKAQTDSLIAPKANATDIYNKTQVDNLVTPKANSSDTYTKAQTDALIGGVTVDLSGYYTKTQTDGLVTPKANSSDITAALSLKANTTDVNTSLSIKANQSTTYTKVEVDGLVAPKANSVDVYTKVQTDTLISGATATGSNVGVGGVGVYKQKTGSNLEFKNINAGSSKVTITNDAANNEIDVDVVEANLTLGNLSGTLPIAKGGTGSTSASAALTALGGATITSVALKADATALTSHTSSTSNPHSVTASQVGAIPTTDKGVALGVATLDSGGKIPDTQIPDAITRDTELTAGLATKADISSTYTKTQTDTLLTAKANQSSTYTKTEVDGLVNPKANSTDVYTKTQTDTLINARPDALNELTDTTITTPFNGQALIYNNTTSKWENQNLPVGSIGISVNISSVNYDSQNRVSSYIINGTNYVITYNTLTTVIVGGGKTRTITYNSTGQLVSDITI